jgi:F-type H+-transporting ATPase subunit gamma
MASLRDIKRKIDAVKKTQQITRAMNMVAAAKLRVAQANMEKFHPYAVKFKEVIGRLAAGVEEDAGYALLTPREARKIEVVSISADRGLCGSFNNNLLMTAWKFIEQKRAEGLEVELTVLGRRGMSFFKRSQVPVREKIEGMLNKPNYQDAYNLGSTLIERFENEEVDEVYIVYSEFVSMAKQIPRVVKLLPASPEVTEDEEEGEAAGVEYLFEPSHAELLTDLLPNSVYIQILECFYQTAVSEHAARMAAMDNATSNCKEMVRDLTLVYNKARQAAVTMELMDLVGGAEALK